jgi:hypothetical protein
VETTYKAYVTAIYILKSSYGCFVKKSDSNEVLKKEKKEKRKRI